MIVRHRIYTSVQSILEILELLVIHNRPCRHNSKLQLSIWSHNFDLNVQQDWYPMYYPELEWRLGLALCSRSILVDFQVHSPLSSNHYTTTAHISFISFRFDPLVFFHLWCTLFLQQSIHDMGAGFRDSHGTFLHLLSWNGSRLENLSTQVCLFEWFNRLNRQGLFLSEYSSGVASSKNGRVRKNPSLGSSIKSNIHTWYPTPISSKNLSNINSLKKFGNGCLRNCWEIVVINNFDIQESFYLEPINKRYISFNNYIQFLFLESST